MKVQLLAFGIAKDILGARSMPYDLRIGNTILDLKGALTSEYVGFEALAKVSFAVNTSYVTDDHILQEGDEVVLIPPVSGG